MADPAVGPRMLLDEFAFGGEEVESSGGTLQPLPDDDEARSNSDMSHSCQEKINEIIFNFNFFSLPFCGFFFYMT